MPLSERENYLRTASMTGPEWIPAHVAISGASWLEWRDEMEHVVARHPVLFPDFRKGERPFDETMLGSRDTAGQTMRDNWGCVWHNTHEGLEGQVAENPLADWAALETYTPPDPLTHEERGERDWAAIEKGIRENKRKGLLTEGNGERLFDRLYFLRGFENLMIDIATDEPRLSRLIEMLEDYEMRLVTKWLEIGVDVIAFHTDIGTQNALMISPEKFRKYIKPMFKRIFTTCREAGTPVSLSSDGRLLEIVDDLVECGVSVHDPQLRANTLDGIRHAYKGKMCIKLDLDRQMFPFCRPEDIRNQVEQAVETLNAPEGGLMMMGAVFGDDVPLANIEALCEAFEQFCLAGRPSS